MSNLRIEFKAMLVSEGLSQRDWSSRAGLHESSVTRLINGGYCGPKILRKIFNQRSWEKPETAARLYKAFLKDQRWDLELSSEVFEAVIA